jgi:hypothetical protein
MALINSLSDRIGRKWVLAWLTVLLAVVSGISCIKRNHTGCMAYIAGQRYRTGSEGLESVGSVAGLYGNGKRIGPNAMCHLYRRMRSHRNPRNTTCELRFRLPDWRIDGGHWSASLANGKFPSLFRV